MLEKSEIKGAIGTKGLIKTLQVPERCLAIFCTLIFTSKFLIRQSTNRREKYELHNSAQNVTLTSTTVFVKKFDYRKVY